MVAGNEHMGLGAGFTARRPNASNLPPFELPPPPLSSFQHKYTSSYPQHVMSTPSTSTTLNGVGSLLTPPSNGSADGLSPLSSGIASNPISSHGTVPPYNSSASSMWQPSSTTASSFGYQTATTAQSYLPGRGIFSPSINSVVRGSTTPSTSEGLPAPPYEIPSYTHTSLPMSAPSLPALPTPQQQQQMISNAMMGGQTSVNGTHSSPINTQDGFARPPPTPSYYSQPSSTPHQPSYSYSSGPSPIQHSPISTNGPLSKMSPVNQSGPIPPLQAHSQSYASHRPYSYPMPVLSNVNNPGGQLALVGPGMPHGSLMPTFNSGHAAQMQQMYGHHAQQQAQHNDRPFKCDQCPQCFNRNHDLKRHKRIHLAVKPFPCGHCEKSFSRKDALKRHVLVKGCGKAQATAEVQELDGSTSPDGKSDSPDSGTRGLPPA